MSQKDSEIKSSADTVDTEALQEAQELSKKMLQSAIQQNMSMFKGVSRRSIQYWQNLHGCHDESVA